MKNNKKPDNTEENRRDKKGRFVNGKSGNPKGKPKGSFSLIVILKKEIQKCPKGKNKKSYAVLLVKKMLDEAIKRGNVRMIKLIWAYIEGMPIQPLEVDSKKNNPIPLLCGASNGVKYKEIKKKNKKPKVKIKRSLLDQE